MNIILYTICWNEQRMLPYFLRHYEQFCEAIIVYDNGSDDGSQDIITPHPLCILRHIDSGGELHEGALLQVKGQMWKESRDTADWVICCDIDELLHHPHLIDFLTDCRDRQISIPVPAGWQMVSEQFPVGSKQLYDEVKTGFPDGRYSKRVIFNPAALAEINYSPGCHSALPEGNIHELADPFLKLLHFKYLGKDYVLSRHRALAQRLSQFNRDHGFGSHYVESEEETALLLSDYGKRSQWVDLKCGK